MAADSVCCPVTTMSGVIAGCCCPCVAQPLASSTIITGMRNVPGKPDPVQRGD